MTSIRGKIASKLMRKLMFVKPIYKRGGLVYFGLISAKRSFFVKPFGYKLDKFKIADIPVEKLTRTNSPNKDKVVLQVHGGAYQIPLIDLFRKIAVKYSKICDGITVFNVDYKVAPTHVYPAARDDVETVFFHLLDEGYKPENIIMVGDSAGGNLILSLVAKLRDEKKPLPKAIVCMSPWTDLAGNGQSYYDNLYLDDQFGMLPNMSLNSHRYHMLNSFSLPYAGKTKLTDKGLSPVYQEYHDFPPMLIQVGGNELLLSDSMTVYKKAKKHNENTTLTIYDGMFHTFQTLVDIPESRRAWKEVEKFIKSQIDLEPYKIKKNHKSKKCESKRISKPRQKNTKKVKN